MTQVECPACGAFFHARPLDSGRSHSNANIFREAVRIIARRQLAETPNVRNPAAWLRSAERLVALDYANRVSRMDLSGMTAESLADRLTPKAPRTTPLLRDERPPCDACGASGWTLSDAGGDLVAVRCVRCR